MSPQKARFMIQGLDILELRVEKCYRYCLSLANIFKSNSKIKEFDYRGLRTTLNIIWQKNILMIFLAR